MSPTRVLELKRTSGWFAAGREIQRAATLWSDAGFKLFVWLCLHAERNSGRLPVNAANLARSLRKAERDIELCLEELAAAGICRFPAPGLIEIQDRFWPYQRTQSQAVPDDSEAYLAAVRRIFLRHGCVCSSFSPADQRLAAAWRRRGVSLEQVERAISLGVARKYVALINNGGGTPITTLHYFAHLIEEVDQMNVSPDYWRHVIARAGQFESRWRTLRAASHPQSTKPEETK
jgi:hypothetical protein